MSGYDDYRRAMNGDHWKGWWVTWPLSGRVRLGDVYDVRSGVLRRAGDLAGRQVGFVAEQGVPESTFVYDSNRSVAVRFKASGSIPEPSSALAKVDAGAFVEFGGEGSSFVVFQGISQLGVADVRQLCADLAERWWSGGWDDSLRAVTSVVSATGGTVLTAAAKGAVAELKLSAGVGRVGLLELVDLATGASVVRSKDLGAEWTGTEVTPFYQVVRLRKNWLGKVVRDYGPRQPGHGAYIAALPPLLRDEVRDDPAAVLTLAGEDEQLPFPDPPDN